MDNNFPKEQLYVLATALIAEMQKPEFTDRAKAAIVQEPVPTTEEDVLMRYESVQADFFNARFDVSQLAVNGMPAPTAALNGSDVLRQMREACLRYKEAETERLITQLCVIEETQIETLIATMPQLAALARAQQTHQHSHGGDAGSHGHSHGGDAGSHGHSHGGAAGSHGHSHGGAAGGAMPQMSPQGVRMVELAMQTLTPEQRDTMERIQSTMNAGSPPTPEDMREMFMIQQHIMAFMTTMQQFQGRGRGGGANTRGGRGANR